MSIYIPKSVKVVQHPDGLFYVWDKFGPLTGGYEYYSYAAEVGRELLKEGRY